jgi:hypothetical protein
MHWLLIVVALCRWEPNAAVQHPRECNVVLESHSTQQECQRSLQEFGSRMVDGKTWHQRNPYKVWCEPT